MTMERSLHVKQRNTSSLLASLHERLAGTVGAKELSELEKRLRGEWAVIINGDVVGPFQSEDHCYGFAAQVSKEPNDWLPTRLWSAETYYENELGNDYSEAGQIADDEEVAALAEEIGF